MKKRVCLVFCGNMLLSYLVLFLDCINFLKYQNSPEDVLLLFDFCLNAGVWSNFLLLISQSFNTYCIDRARKDNLFVLKTEIFSAISICIGCMAFVIFCSLFLPLVDSSGSELQSFMTHYESTKQYKTFFCLTPLLLNRHYILYFTFSIYFIFLNCLLWAVVGYVIHILVKNKYVSSIFTFFIYYLESHIIVNKINLLLHLDLYTTKNFMLGNFNFQSSVMGNILLLTIFYTIIIFLLIKISCFIREKKSMPYYIL